MEKFHWVIYIFGGFLIVTGLRMGLQKHKESTGKQPGPQAFSAIHACHG